MGTGDDPRAALAEARRHHRVQLNDALRRPGMYGRDETAELLLLEAMAAVEGSLPRWRTERDRLRAASAVTSTGVRGACSTILPVGAVRGAVASVYAGIAARCGWLDLDRTLPDDDWRRLAAGIGAWVTQDRTLSAVLATFEPPSVWIGGTNPFYAKTLVYATTEPGDTLVCLHLWNAFANPPGEKLRGVHPEPVLLAVRHRPGPFPESFSSTPEGLHRRPTGDQQSPARATAWVFHGEQARYASGVFETADDGLAWAAEHEVSGSLSEYPYGGAYDIAVREGRFTPSKAHHGTAGHVAGFNPGLQDIHLTAGHRRD